MNCPFLFLFICIRPVAFQSCPTLLLVFICNLLFSFVLLLPLAQLSYITPSTHFILPIPSLLNTTRPIINGCFITQPNRMPAPTSQQNQQQHASNLHCNVGTPTSVGEVNGRVAMILAQMQAQAAHPEVLLTITSSNGPPERSATFRDGAWHGYDVTHNLVDPRSHMIYGEPNRTPIDQERSFRISPPTIQPLHQTPQPHQPQPPAPPQPTTFNCTLTLVPPPILTPPMHRNLCTHLLINLQASCTFPPFRGEGCK